MPAAYFAIVKRSSSEAIALRANRTDLLVVRRGQQEDLESIAQLAIEAGGDVVEFLAGVFGDRASAIGVYRSMLGEPNSIFSFSECHVATVNVTVMGFANGFSARLLRGELPTGNLLRENRIFGPGLS